MFPALSTATVPAPAAVLVPPPGRSPLAGGLQSRQALETALHGRLWRGSSLGVAADPTLPSGFAALDTELPGGGWPMRAAIELLAPQFGVLEWRLLAPALRSWWEKQAPPAANPGRRQRPVATPLRSLLLVNPPHTPHLPGLQALGLPPSALIWVSAKTSAEALWAAEQAIKSRVAVLAWLPEARPEQIRRLQVSALSSDAPLFLMRPESAARQSSAAPLRLVVQPGEGWSLAVHLLKRRGPAHEGWLTLPATPGAVEPLLTAAKRKGQQPSPAPAPSPVPVNPPAERTDALARTVLHA
ncbi:MAG: recombinase RecA [Burkholderiales bacterium]|jgi:protein ImuA|nr:recombinase RecA [Burkholderiales bacterium]